MGDVLNEIRERTRRWCECPRHRFEPARDGYRLGQRLTCTVCGVDASLTAVGEYIRGYQAAGGDARDIAPDWKQRPDPAPVSPYIRDTLAKGLRSESEYLAEREGK